MRKGRLGLGLALVVLLLDGEPPAPDSSPAAPVSAPVCLGCMPLFPGTCLPVAMCAPDIRLDVSPDVAPADDLPDS